MDRIMLLDDEPMILKSLERLLRRQKNWEIESFTEPHEALKRAQTGIYELFISDYMMPEMNGIEFLNEVRQLQPNSQRILLTGRADIEGAVRAINEAKIFRLLFKPWNDVELIDAIEKALEYRYMLQKYKYLTDQIASFESRFEQLVEQYDEHSPMVNTIRELIHQLKK